jgi:hypothetical protein
VDVERSFLTRCPGTPRLVQNTDKSGPGVGRGVPRAPVVGPADPPAAQRASRHIPAAPVCHIPAAPAEVASNEPWLKRARRHILPRPAGLPRPGRASPEGRSTSLAQRAKIRQSPAGPGLGRAMHRRLPARRSCPRRGLPRPRSAPPSRAPRRWRSTTPWSACEIATSPAFRTARVSQGPARTLNPKPRPRSRTRIASQTDGVAERQTARRLRGHAGPGGEASGSSMRARSLRTRRSSMQQRRRPRRPVRHEPQVCRSRGATAGVLPPRKRPRTTCRRSCRTQPQPGQPARSVPLRRTVAGACSFRGWGRRPPSGAEAPCSTLSSVVENTCCGRRFQMPAKSCITSGSPGRRQARSRP